MIFIVFLGRGCGMQREASGSVSRSSLRVSVPEAPCLGGVVVLEVGPAEAATVPPILKPGDVDGAGV